MNANILERAYLLLDQLHGASIADAREALDCARRMIDGQAGASLVNKDHDAHNDLTALGIRREMIGG